MPSKTKTGFLYCHIHTFAISRYILSLFIFPMYSTHYYHERFKLHLKFYHFTRILIDISRLHDEAAIYYYSFYQYAFDDFSHNISILTTLFDITVLISFTMRKSRRIYSSTDRWYLRERYYACTLFISLPFPQEYFWLLYDYFIFCWWVIRHDYFHYIE